MSRAWPLMLYGTRVRTTEHLYQAMRFSAHPDFQREVLSANKPKAAKLISREYDELTRVDWLDVRVDVMRWCLEIRLAQHLTRLGSLLEKSGERPIVEFSKRDTFWGAEPSSDGTLTGMNVLGNLFDELRTKWRAAQSNNQFENLTIVAAPMVPDFRFLGLPVNTIHCNDDGIQPRLVSSDDIYRMGLCHPSQAGELAAWCRQAQLNGNIKTKDTAISTLRSVFRDRIQHTG